MKMARRKRATVLDKVLSKILAVGFVFIIIIAIFTSYPILAITIGILAVIAMAYQVRKCELCGAMLKRQSYTWEIKGEKKKICPKCNNNLENKRSREAVRNL